MSARYECQDCDFVTASVHMAEAHERRRDDHEVYEVELNEAEDLMEALKQSVERASSRRQREAREQKADR